MTESVHGAKEIKEVLAWFDAGCLVIFPEFELGPLVVELVKHPEFKDRLARYLKCLDTGIVDVRLESRDSETFRIPSGLRKQIEAGLSGREISSVTGPDQANGFQVEAKMDHSEWRSSCFVITSIESQRRIDFRAGRRIGRHTPAYGAVPGHVQPINSDILFAVDEFDRSLHPQIVHSYRRQFLEVLGRQRQSAHSDYP